MRFKYFPTWLKVGIYFVMVSLISYFGSFIFSNVSVPDFIIFKVILTFLWVLFSWTQFLIFGILLIILSSFLNLPLIIHGTRYLEGDSPTLLGAIIVVCFWFLIGAFIGYKIKKRKIHKNEKRY